MGHYRRSYLHHYAQAYYTLSALLSLLDLWIRDDFMINCDTSITRLKFPAIVYHSNYPSVLRNSGYENLVSKSATPVSSCCSALVSHSGNSGSITKDKVRLQSIVVSTDQYTKLKTGKAVNKEPSAYSRTVIVNNWIIPNKIATYVMTDNRTKFVSQNSLPVRPPFC